MSASPSVSVIMPVHNGAGLIRHALESIENQTAHPAELIIVDDGSTDDSVQVIAAFLAESSIRTRVITQENQGQSASRNTAAESAAGEYLAFLDQDDLWRPRHLERLIDAIELDENHGWVYSDFDEIDDHGLVVTRNYMHSVGAIGPRLSVMEIIQRDGMIIPSASVIRKCAFDEVGGFDPELRGYEDDDLFLRIFRSGWRSRFVDEALTAFRVHAGSSSTCDNFLESRMKFYAKVSRELPDNVRLGRYYVTDLLRPRILHSSLVDYSAALSLRQYAEARHIARRIAELFSSGPLGARRRMGLSILRKPRLSRLLLRLHISLPRLVRPRIPQGLTVKR